MIMANQKITWNIRKSKSVHNVVVVEKKASHVVTSAGSVRIHCFSDAKIHILRGETK